ncbi:SUMF1/EgtB/PvdO family nonheme iron enzyme [Kaarinaea lacus]
MADIFIIYAPPDRGTAKALAGHLNDLGYSVWWGRDIEGNRLFNQVIEGAVQDAKVVIVLWSRHSVEWDWVCFLTSMAFGYGTLVPVTIEKDVDPPQQFINIPTLNLADTKSIVDSTGYKKLIRDLRTKIPRGDAGEVETSANTANSYDQQAKPQDTVLRRTQSQGKEQLQATVFHPPQLPSQISKAAAPHSAWKRYVSSSLWGAVLVTVLVGVYSVLVPGNNSTSAVTTKTSVEKTDSAKYKPGEVFRDNLNEAGEGPEMVVIPAGKFRMGDVQGSGLDRERPVHEVIIKEPFAMGRYEVTFEEYDRFAKATGREMPLDNRWGRGNRPVISVSWNDAVAYTIWLSEQSGQQYRLPSEAEWEYAAKAGTETDYWWGNDVGENNANCEFCGSQGEGGQTALVGSFKPNPFGLYDTAGNLSEWVQDCWDYNYNSAPLDGSAWEPKNCRLRVLRGGWWGVGSWNARSTQRDREVADFRSASIGIRLARTL